MRFISAGDGADFNPFFLQRDQANSAVRPKTGVLPRSPDVSASYAEKTPAYVKLCSFFRGENPMGLLDSVMSAVSSQVQGGEGLQGLMGMLGNQPQIMQAASSLLGNDGQLGGLQGLMEKFQQGGLGDVLSSWIGKGENLPISAEQLQGVLGNDTFQNLANQFGVNPKDLAGQLSSVLPGLVDQLTPDGQMPSAGLGNGGNLMGMLGGLLKG
jgi:uncharacterized protein YidB (DUF937 family)